RRLAEESDYWVWVKGRADFDYDLAVTNANDREYESARTGYREAREGYRRLQTLQPDRVFWLKEELETQEMLCSLLYLSATSTGDLPTEMAASPEYAEYEQELEERERLVLRLIERQPNKPDWRYALAQARTDLADRCHLKGEVKKVDPTYRAGLDELKDLPAKNPLAQEAAISLFAQTRATAVSHLDKRDQLVNDDQYVAEDDSLGMPLKVTHNLIDHVAALLRSLKDEGQEHSDEARWTLRRYLGLLRDRQDAGKLHPYHVKLLVYFEK